MQDAAVSAIRSPRPFWHCLGSFFLFPFQVRPLIYAVVLALASLMHVVVSPIPFGSFIVAGGILIATLRYGFKIMSFGSTGIAHSRDFPASLDNELKNLPWKFIGLSLVQLILVGALALVNWRLMIAGGLIVSFTLPATAMVLVQTSSIGAALNPALVASTIRAVGWPYAVLCLFLFLICVGSSLVTEVLVTRVGPLAILPAIHFVAVYFGWVMASLLGYVMFQHHDALGIDPVAGAGEAARPAEVRTPAQIAQQQTDDLVERLVADGDVNGALGFAYEAQRTQPDDVAAHRRYHRVLLLAPFKLAAMLTHARRFIDLLVQRNLVSEALKVYAECRAADATFVVDEPATTMILARHEWRSGNAKAALAILAGFDKRFKGHASIPQAYELAARVLVQGLGRSDMAKPILRTLENRYPASEQTSEVRWLLRDMPAAPPA